MTLHDDFLIEKSSEKAKKRWKLLSDVLLLKKSQKAYTTRPKLEQTFDLLKIAEEETCKNSNGKFSFQVRFRNEFFESNFLKISVLTNSTDLQDLIGFDNTGNVRIWPSEEILSYYCVKNKQFFENKFVCELGAGMTGLASFFLAATGLPKRVLITDGNEKSAENLKYIKETNSFDVEIETRRLLWTDDDETAKEIFNEFDVILAADCFFFKSADKILLKTIHRLLKPKGTAIFFAPLRNGTFLRFVEAVKDSKMFRIAILTDDYCSKITEIKENLLKQEKFDFNYVYPYMLQIEKIGEFENNLSAADFVLTQDNQKIIKFPHLS